MIGEGSQFLEECRSHELHLKLSFLHCFKHIVWMGISSYFALYIVQQQAKQNNAL